MPINIQTVNDKIIEQNEALRLKFKEIGEMEETDEVKLYGALTHALHAIYERQGDQIILNLTTGGR